MAAPTCTLDSLDLNDGTIYTISGPVTIGERLKSFDEYRGLDGTVTQANVTEAILIDVTIPIHVQKDSAANLRTALATINTKIDGCTAAAPKVLAYASTNYSIVASPRVGWVEDDAFLLKFWTEIVVALKRLP
jgi:hypothetical protein